jgi:hypothetical protein
MALNEELDGLLNKAESQIKVSIKKNGGFDSFALILKNDGGLDTLHGPDEPLYGSNELAYFIAGLMPLARRGEIKASVICTSMSASDGSQKAAIIDLEHHDFSHALVILPYERRLLSWSFGARQFTQKSPALFTRQEAALCEVTHQEFVLKLGQGWRRIAAGDPEQFTFYSDDKKTSVVISVMMIGPIALDRLLGVANRLADSRLSIEREIDPTRNVTMGNCNVELKESGQVGHVAYAGCADSGHIFRFMGWVTQRKVLSFWVSTETRDNEHSKNVFNEVFGGFRFFIP